MLILSIALIVCYPAGREDRRRVRLGFNGSTSDEVSPRACMSRRLDLSVQARIRQTAPYRVLSGECVVVVVGNYFGCSWIYEEICTSACTSGFVTRVESRNAPETMATSYKPLVTSKIGAYGSTETIHCTRFTRQ